MVMQISAVSLSLKFYSGKSYVKKITVFTFQQFVSTSHVKLRSLNQKLQSWVFLGQVFAFRAANDIFTRKITAKRVTPTSFHFFSHLTSFTLVSNNIYCQKRLNWTFLMHAFANILIKEKYKLKIKHFFIKVGINKPSFCQSIDRLWLYKQNNQC